ncbi:MAG: rhomboid family intramembrane serine protease [Lachnospirales bacterium]
MFGSFTTSFFTALIQNDFRPVKFMNNDIIINNETKYISLGKQGLGGFYIINLVNCNYFKDFLTDYSELLACAESNIVTTTILLNILVSENPDDEFMRFIDSTSLRETNTLNQMFWYMNLKNKTIYTNKNQPNNVLNIRNILKSSTFTKNYAPISLNTLCIHALLTSPFKPKILFIKLANIITLITVISTMFMLLKHSIISDSVVLQLGAMSSVRVFEYNEYYRLFTSIFINPNFVYTIVASLFLYYICGIFEKYFGNMHFISIYLLTAIVGNIVMLFTTTNIYCGSMYGVSGVLGALSFISFKFNKHFSGLTNIHLLMLTIMVLMYSFTSSVIYLESIIASLTLGLVFGFIMSIEIKNKKNSTRS